MTYFFDHGFGDVRVVAISTIAFAGLDLDVDLDMTFSEVQYFAQGGYLLGFGPTTWEVGGGVEAAQVGKIEVEDVSGAIGSFVDGGVVKDDGVPIPTHVYVKFDGVNGQGEGITKSGECIFRGKMRASAMGNSLNAVTHRWYSTSPLDRKTMLYRSNSTTETVKEGKIRGDLFVIYVCKRTAQKGYGYMKLELGMTGEATTTVVHENTAAAVGAGGVEVFGTPMMIALMENAAWRAVAASLDEGDVTLGVLVNVQHLGATPLGQQVRATAELAEIDGRRLVFKVEAYDEQKKIGAGIHERFIVNLERFLKRLARL